MRATISSKKILFHFISPALFFLAISDFSATAQNLDYTFLKQVGGTNDEDVFGITLDNSGNILLTGYFSGTANFGGTNLTSAGGSDVFVAKYNSIGDLLWATRAGGLTGEVGYSIATDNLGNIFTTGRFLGTADFPGVNGETTNLTSSGAEDIYVAKYDQSGNVLWARRAGGGKYDFGRAIVVDASGNAYVTGSFQSTTPTFDSFTLTAIGKSDVFIAKYDPNGTVLWVRQYSGANDYAEGYGLALDTDNNLYVTGRFRNIINFGATTLTTPGDFDIFVAKFDSDGFPIWANRAGGVPDEYGYNVAVDASGNVFATGFFAGPGTFGSSTNLPGDGTSDAFLAKYDSVGNLVWAQQSGGDGVDEGYGLKLDSFGNIFVTGWFQNTATFGTTNLTASGGSDIFLAKYNTAGNLLSIQQAGGNLTDVGRSLVIGTNNSIFLTGYFNDAGQFGKSNVTASFTNAIFFARLDELPALQVSRIPSQVVLSWPTNYLGFILQTATNLNFPTTWLSATNTPAIVNGQFTVTNSISDSSQFYRLKK